MTYSFRSNLFTGIIVLLPISLFVLVLVWLYRLLESIIFPLTTFYDVSAPLSILITLLLLVVVLFLVGVAAKTKIGTWFFVNLDKHVFSYLPGFNLIKQILTPFIGEGYKKSFKSVALVDIWANGSLMTAFITDKTDKYATVFVPTGPNPTSGNIYHVPNKRVYVVDAKVEHVLSSVISVGAGSKKILEKLEKKRP